MKIVLLVEHRGERKMSGKIFRTAGKLVFFHEAGGSQWHNALNSPGGIDVEVIEFLKENAVAEIWHFDRSDEVLYLTSVGVMDDKGILQISDERCRRYLPVSYWKQYPATVKQAVLKFGQRTVKIPWIKQEHTVGLHTHIAAVPQVIQTALKATVTSALAEPPVQADLFGE